MTEQIPPPQITNPKRPILIVDDNPDVTESIAIGLEIAFQDRVVLREYNGNKALETYQKHRPLVSIVDAMLPGRSGYSVLEKIKDLDPDAIKFKRVIMITGNRGIRHKLYGERLGARAYLFKPVKLETLISLTKEIIEE